MLQGVTTDHVLTTAIMGWEICLSSSPVALSMARAGARDGPDLISSLGILLLRISLAKKNPHLNRCGFFRILVGSV
jgi:hypothetical protein